MHWVNVRNRIPPHEEANPQNRATHAKDRTHKLNETFALAIVL